MIKRNILELETRRRIYNLILEYPGLHIREISRRIDIPFSTLKYHLNYLEKRELIRAKSEGVYSRYYVTNEIGRKEKKILGLLRQDIPRSIILLLLAYVECSQKEISENLEKHPATITYHLKKLQDMGIIGRVSVNNGLIHEEKIPIVIERSKVTNEIIYMLKNLNVIYDSLITYKDNLLDNTTSNLILDYMHDFLSDGVPEKIKSPKSAIDSISETIYELFPLPFCA